MLPDLGDAGAKEKSHDMLQPALKDHHRLSKHACHCPENIRPSPPQNREPDTAWLQDPKPSPLPQSCNPWHQNLAAFGLLEPPSKLSARWLHKCKLHLSPSD